VQSVTVGTT